MAKKVKFEPSSASQLNVLQRLARHLGQGCRMSIFRAFILTHFNYCALVWHFWGATNTKKHECIQCRALRFRTRRSATIRRFLTEPVYRHWSSHGNEKSSSRSTRLSCHLSPPFMWGVFTPKLMSYNLRNSNKLYIPHMNTTKYGLRSFSAYGATLWNSLPGHIKSCGDLNSFKT